MDNLNNLMKEAQKMQKRMQDAQEQLTQLEVLGEAGGGMVKITMNGRHNALKAQIKASLIDEDVEMLEDLVVAAINDAVRRIESESQQKIKELTSGLNIPTDFMNQGGSKE
ncbi:MAG: YbaB/EbfC family nucleoid-associated protein [Legionellaceae bacterium]|nr:YbaB/EbfC family nucleoid-associated protein [Legionellaceae bacterium]